MVYVICSQTIYVVQGGVLASQELARLEDESSRNEDVEMNVWAYQQKQDQERRYSGKGGSGLCDGQDEERKVEMVRACEEVMHAPVRRCEKLAIVGMRRVKVG